MCDKAYEKFQDLSMFEMILSSVMDDLGMVDCYELFEENKMNLVEKHCSEYLGYDCRKNKNFVEWYNELAEDYQ